MNHDAAMAVVDGTDILWAAHAERYSKVKNDFYLNQAIVDEAKTYGPFDKVVYYEKPLLKNLIPVFSSPARSILPAHSILPNEPVDVALPLI